MPVYHLSTRIRANIPPSYLLYDLCIYRMDSRRNKYCLVDVKQQPLQGNYETQRHATDDINDPLSTIYIMEVTLYRTTLLETICVSLAPFTHMYTLEEFANGKAWSAVKRENPCYFESIGIPKPVSQGGETKDVKISIPERPFIAKEYPIGNALDPFEKNLIEQQIDNRFNHFDSPSQIEASVCGPAAFFYCLQKDRPDIYAQAARELWRYGKTKIGQLEISPSEGCRHPYGSFYYDNGNQKISGLDWITLAGLRDSENKILTFDTLDSPFAGITMWQILTEWFEKAGYKMVFSNVGVSQAGINGIRALNEYAKKGYKVVTLINDGLLDRGLSISTVPTHWIVWEGPVTLDSSGIVQLNLYSWGDVGEKIKNGKDLNFFIKRFFGGVVFKPSK
ncbi:MAG: hypothetical protein P4L95_11890 [Rouxiella aceris]|uniref:hypothetical protein n=1 Tax=Rouxiella aceris TaxID=2703884 RepID=UPI002845FDE6|nr:hypothetical protein [Rouxiella aceris]MDR3432582.1 hypothetical protein [Rouxiella aceris]